MSSDLVAKIRIYFEVRRFFKELRKAVREEAYSAIQKHKLDAEFVDDMNYCSGIFRTYSGRLNRV